MEVVAFPREDRVVVDPRDHDQVAPGTSKGPGMPLAGTRSWAPLSTPGGITTGTIARAGATPRPRHGRHGALTRSPAPAQAGQGSGRPPATPLHTAPVPPQWSHPRALAPGRAPGRRTPRRATAAPARGRRSPRSPPARSRAPPARARRRHGAPPAAALAARRRRRPSPLPCRSYRARAVGSLSTRYASTISSNRSLAPRSQRLTSGECWRARRW